jgi:hypothetical protein
MKFRDEATSTNRPPGSATNVAVDDDDDSSADWPGLGASVRGRIRTRTLPSATLKALAEVHRDSKDFALVLAAHGMADMTGIEVLAPGCRRSTAMRDGQCSQTG